MNTRAAHTWILITLIGFITSACGASPSSGSPVSPSVSTVSSGSTPQASPTIATSVAQIPTIALTAAPTASLNISFQSSIWKPIGPPGIKGVSSIIVLPTQPSTILVASGNVVYRSTDDGGTWNQSTGLPTDASVSYMVAPLASPTIVYVQVRPTTTVGSVWQIYRSTDNGSSWTAVKRPDFGPDEGAETGALLEKGFLIGPQPGRLFVANEAKLYQSLDDGSTWTKLTAPEETKTVMALAFDPQDPNIIILLTDTQDLRRLIYRSIDNGKTWVPAQKGIPNAVVIVNLVTVPTTPPTLLALAVGSLQSKQPSGFESDIYQSTDWGESWSQAYVGPNTGRFGVSLDPTTPGTIYAATQNGFFRSQDSGRTWELINSNMPNVGGGRPSNPQVDPNNPVRLYVTAGSDVFKIEGKGESP